MYAKNGELLGFFPNNSLNSRGFWPYIWGTYVVLTFVISCARCLWISSGAWVRKELLTELITDEVPLSLAFCGGWGRSPRTFLILLFTKVDGWSSLQLLAVCTQVEANVVSSSNAPQPSCLYNINTNKIQKKKQIHIQIQIQPSCLYNKKQIQIEI